MAVENMKNNNSTDEIFNICRHIQMKTATQSGSTPKPL